MKNRRLLVAFVFALCSLFAAGLEFGYAQGNPAHNQILDNQTEILQNQAEISQKLDDLAVEHTEILEKLDALALGCTGQRFVDREITVYDCDTNLEWEKKTAGNVNDVYEWSTEAPWDPDGPAFDYIDQLNTPPCFAEHCDWRLPEVNVGSNGVRLDETTPADTAELETILLPGAPGSCPGFPDPCIDPIFGPTAASTYWSSVTDALGPGGAWGVNFPSGNVVSVGKGAPRHVRAVRTGP